MDIYDKLEHLAVSVLTATRMRSAVDRNNSSATAFKEGIKLIEFHIDDLKREVIKFYEEQILNSDDILSEAIYKSLLSYYDANGDNQEVINKILAQNKKNKFKKYCINNLLENAEINSQEINQAPKTQGKRIKEIRKALGYTQQVFADILGVSKQYFSRVENNITELSTGKLQILIEKCNVNANYVLLGRGNMFLN